LAFLFVGEARADDLRLDGKFLQGGLVQGTVQTGTKVTFEGWPVRVSAKGRFLIGFSRNAGPTFSLTVRLPDGRQINKLLKIGTRKYQIQRIDGLPQKMVTPPKAFYDRIRAENATIANARAKDTAEDHFESGWIWPTQGRISGVYGSQRILNGKPRRPHFGLDIAAPVGTPVVSPADAVVALAHRGMYYTGGTLILDHGHGLTSAMLHMDTLEVVTGDFVRKGQRIGTIGKTGRATGPHLDWRVNLFKARLDPAFLVPPMPSPKQK
jgi:murein DD-endopeptidase MepM/ murein hydrolase activator NlpD